MAFQNVPLVCLIEEFRITPARMEAIRALLAEAFVESAHTATRTYSKQIPPRRLLAMEGDKLIGHVALEHRVIGTTDGPARIFGVIDVAVAATARGRGTASAMLQHIEQLAASHNIDFLILFATDCRLYEKHGYRHADNTLRWMMIDEHRTIGIDEQPLAELMVKEVGKRAWPDGLVDLLGYQS